MKHETQRQHEFNRQVGVERLPTRRPALRRRPPGQCRFVQPQGEIAASSQTCLIRRPVRDAVAGARDAMAAGRVVFKRHARKVAAPPSPSHRATSMHQSRSERAVVDRAADLQQLTSLSLSFGRRQWSINAFDQRPSRFGVSDQNVWYGRKPAVQVGSVLRQIYTRSGDYCLRSNPNALNVELGGSPTQQA